MIGLPDSAKDRFFAHVARHLSIAWQATPLDEGYADSYRLNGWHLDAVRQMRDFRAWHSGSGSTEKDSLTGKEEALLQGSGNPDKSNLWHSLIHKHADHLGAVAIIKRCWHLAYLRDQKNLKTDSRDFPIRSIPAIAARTSKLDDEEGAQENSSGEKYIAAIAFDGDSIGHWVNGDDLPDHEDLEKHHESFSAALSNFALGKARRIVESDHHGQLIYAGGDDVVCLVPADAALECAAALRSAFVQSTKGIKDENGKSPDASVGVAIGHIHAPLQDLIREAQKAEKRAKNEVGRPAFSVTLMKRSGEISHWGSKWESGGLPLYHEIALRLDAPKLTAKFPHRVCSLLTPYLVNTTRLMMDQNTLGDAEGFNSKEIILREFAFAISRQSASGKAGDNESSLSPLLDFYLEKLPTDHQSRLSAIIGLCTTVAFAHRTKPETAEKQLA